MFSRLMVISLTRALMISGCSKTVFRYFQKLLPLIPWINESFFCLHSSGTSGTCLIRSDFGSYRATQRRCASLHTASSDPMIRAPSDRLISSAVGVRNSNAKALFQRIRWFRTVNSKLQDEQSGHCIPLFEPEDSMTGAREGRAPVIWRENAWFITRSAARSSSGRAGSRRLCRRRPSRLRRPSGRRGPDPLRC